MYSPIIDDNTYGPSRVNVESQRNDPDSMWNAIRQMISIRKQNRVFGWGEFEWADCRNDKVAAFQRTFEGKTVWAVHNLSDAEQRVSLHAKGPAKPLNDLLTQKEFVFNEGGIDLKLAPYQYLWLK